MPVYELVLSSDTINEGRIKINDAFSATTGLWSGGTGEQSLTHNNGSGNIAASENSIVGGGNNIIDIDSSTSFIFSTGSTVSASTYASIVGGVNNDILYSNNSSIFGGGSNNISSSNNNETNYAGIFAGFNNYIQSTDVGNGSNRAVIIGGNGNTIDSSNGNDTISSGIFAGSNNILSGSSTQGAILGGSSNTLTSSQSIILGGNSNEITSGNAIILGGSNNLIPNSRVNSIVAGSNVESRSANTFSMGYAFAGGANVVNNTIALEYTDGSLYYNGTLNAGAADYAEFFEWNDENLLNENRFGYFVCLSGEKIEIGNSDVIGIVSSNPAIVGDSSSMQWKDTFLKDEWGVVLRERYEIYQLGNKEIFIDEKNNVYSEPPSANNLLGILYDNNIDDKIFLREDYAKKINPSYVSNIGYIPRKDRQEWSPIGLLGKLHVRTSEQITDPKISVDSDGMAINGTDYHVLKSIKNYDGDYGIVQVLFK